MPDEEKDNLNLATGASQDERQSVQERGQALFGATLAGRYKIEKIIDWDDCSEAFAGVDLLTSTPIRILVLNLFPGRQIDQKSFQNRAKLLQSLSYDGWEEVLFCGIIDGAGRPFMVTSVPVGERLDHLVNQGGPLSPYCAVKMMLSLCSSLEFAHKKGIVHGNINPSSVLVLMEHEPKTTLRDPRLLLSHVHRAHVRLEDSPFVSEDVCLGQNPDKLSDIYSLGAVLLYALTAHPPLRNTHISLDESSPDPQANREVLTSLVQTIERCTHKDKTLRFQSVREVRKSIASCIGSFFETDWKMVASVVALIFVFAFAFLSLEGAKFGGAKINEAVLPSNRPPFISIQGVEDPYRLDLERRIYRAWFPPRGESGRRVVVAFKIHALGELSNLRIKNSSGHDSADQAALQAVQNASPFRPLLPGAPPIVDIEAVLGNHP